MPNANKKNFHKFDFRIYGRKYQNHLLSLRLDPQVLTFVETPSFVEAAIYFNRRRSAGQTRRASSIICWCYVSRKAGQSTQSWVKGTHKKLNWMIDKDHIQPSLISKTLSHHCHSYFYFTFWFIIKEKLIIKNRANQLM